MRLLGLPRNRAALGLAIIPGLIAVYGLGHIYFGKTRRGFAFLASAAVPFGLVGLSLLWAQIPWFLSTIAWFALWVWQWHDLSRLTKEIH